jgi:hypothetical protein
MLVITLAARDTTSPRVIKRILPGIFASLLGVLIGFSLSVASDYWKFYHAQQAELRRATTSVDQEVDNNLQLISGDLDILDQDNAAPTGQEVVRPISSLLTSAGETAYLHGSFDSFSKDLSVKLGNTYSSLFVLNKRIEGREMYRLTNQSMDNYDRRRKLINIDIDFLLRKAHDDLTALHIDLSKVK